MIAPLWDDLRFAQASNIFRYYDAQTHRLIIEWYRMRDAANTTDFTFEAILYDHRFWPTLSGDQDILFQYKTFAAVQNVRAGDDLWAENIPYASVGISSPDGKTGIASCFRRVKRAPCCTRYWRIVAICR